MSDRVFTTSPGEPGDHSDPLDGLLEQLRGQHPPGPFAPAEAVRGRGRQRARGQALVVGVAVLAVAGLGAATVSAVATEPPQLGGAPPAGPDPAATAAIEPAPPPGDAPPGDARPDDAPPGVSAEPGAVAPDEIPPGWFLSGADLGPDWTATASHELFHIEPPWLWGGYCEGFDAFDYPSLAGRRDLAVGSWTRDSDPLGRIDQVVELFDDAAAATANLDDVRRVVARCSGVPMQGATAAPVTLAVVDEGFAGDEALMIREEIYFFEGESLSREPEIRLSAVVRVGSVITTLVYDVDDPLIHEYSRIAADRLP